MSSIPMTGYKLAPSYEVASSTPNYLASMGLTAEAVADKYNVNRDEADEFAVRSHQLAAAAISGGKFKDEIVPVEVEEVTVANNKRVSKKMTVDTDEGVRPGTSKEVLAKLRPVFANKGIVTAVAGVEPLYMGIGPCAAIPKALKQADMKLKDIDLIELNEAFATQSLAVIREAGLNPDI
ncbi:unnamed protein product, partial [Cyprideis torosa]